MYSIMGSHSGTLMYWHANVQYHGEPFWHANVQYDAEPFWRTLMYSIMGQAVQCLDGQSSQSSSAQSDRTARRPGRAILPSSSRFSSPSQASTSTSSCISALAERNSLFNFTKRSSCSSSGGRKAKEKAAGKSDVEP